VDWGWNGHERTWVIIAFDRHVYRFLAPARRRPISTDAGFAAFWVLREEHSDASEADGDERDTHTPPHFVAERPTATIAADFMARRV
jgi:hypothetical protein